MTAIPGGGLEGSKSVGRISDLVISTREVEAGAVLVLARKLLTLSSQEAGSRSREPLRRAGWRCGGEYLLE